MRANKSKEIPIARLHELFTYKDGLLLWKRHRGNSIKGSVAGTKTSVGYLRIGKSGLMAHRIIWAMHNNRWPIDFIDHINGNKSDNRIENLREADYSLNQHNLKKHQEGKHVGVYYYATNKRRPWAAQAPKKFLNRNAKNRPWIGNYATYEEACAAVVKFCLERV